MSFKFWLRINVIAYGAILAFLVFGFLAVPGLQIPWRVYVAPLLIQIAMWIPVTLPFFINRRVKVWDGNLLLMHASSSIRIKADFVLSSELDSSDPARVRWNLRFRTRRGKEAAVSIGVPPHVDLVELMDAAGPFMTGSLVVAPDEQASTPS